MQRYRDVYEERKCKFNVEVKVYFEKNLENQFYVEVFFEFKIF